MKGADNPVEQQMQRELRLRDPMKKTAVDVEIHVGHKKFAEARQGLRQLSQMKEKN